MMLKNSSKPLLLTLNLIACSCLFIKSAYAFDYNILSPEERRVSQAEALQPLVVNRHQPLVDNFAFQLNKARNLTAMTQLVLRHAPALWKEAAFNFNELSDYDDRPLYWARLQMVSAIKKAPEFKNLLPSQQEKLLWLFELLSRGQKDVKFDKNADKKVIVVGFDPLIRKNEIKQSNPSGIAALEFDDLFLSIGGQTMEVESLILPLRFTDFDKGIVEDLLGRYYKFGKADMIFTLNMGNDSFELSRFAGLRRSSTLVDNLLKTSGASEETPLVPELHSRVKISEFLSSSLPFNALKNVRGPFVVQENIQVITTKKRFEPQKKSQLIGEISVAGSAGGDFSNELFYRTLLLREMYQPLLTVGHIELPYIEGYQPKKAEMIVKQLKNMIIQASAKLSK